MENNRSSLAAKVTRRAVGCNILLVAFKLFAGIFAGSAAMLSDAVHSITDIVGDVIVFIGIKLARPEPDSDHQYGHERVECIAGILVAAILFWVGLAIGWSGLRVIINGQYQYAYPGILALIAAIVSIIAKEALYRYIRAAAKRLDSVALLASALHSRSDALSSVGSFVGILGARMGVRVLDSIAGVVISIFIIRAAVQIFISAARKITDKAVDEETAAKIRDITLSQPGVLGVDLIKTRMFGDRIFIDLEISSDGAATLTQAHDTAQLVHDAIQANLPKVKHCMIHVNPA